MDRTDLSTSPATKAAIMRGPSSATKAAIDAARSPQHEAAGDDANADLFAPDGPVYNPTAQVSTTTDGTDGTGGSYGGGAASGSGAPGGAAPKTAGVFRSLHCTHCEEMVALWHCDDCGGRFCSHCDAFIHKANCVVRQMRGWNLCAELVHGTRRLLLTLGLLLTRTHTRTRTLPLGPQQGRPPSEGMYQRATTQ